MLFDKFCGIIEKDKSNFFEDFPNLKDDLKYKVKLFHIVEKNKNIEKYIFYDVPDAYQNFFLPFPVIAVEEKDYVILMFDTEENQRGLSGIRKVIYFNNVEIYTTEFKCFELQDFIGYRHHKYALLLNNRIVTNVNVPDKIKTIQSKYIVLTLREIIDLNTPNKFILEERPINGQGKVNSKKIPRSNRRSKFIFLSPGEIKKRYLGYGNQTKTKGTKKPHERRRHQRKYPDDPDRFPNVHGKTIIIPACWVGTQERQVGNT